MFNRQHWGQKNRKRNILAIFISAVFSFFCDFIDATNIVCVCFFSFDCFLKKKPISMHINIASIYNGICNCSLVTTSLSLKKKNNNWVSHLQLLKRLYICKFLAGSLFDVVFFLFARIIERSMSFDWNLS